MDFLRDYFKIEIKFFLPIFIILYVAIFYLSTKYLITDDLLLSNFDGTQSAEELEGGHTFFNLFFGLFLVTSLLGIFIKAGLLAFLISLVLNNKFIEVLKILLLSSSVYVIGRAIQFIVFGLLEPEKIKTLETNIFSIHAIINPNNYGSFIQNLAYDISLIEVAFMAMVISGLYMLNDNSLLRKIIPLVVVFDLVYIVLSALL